MKGFLRFLILLLVVSIIVGLVYFLVLKNNEYKENNPEPVATSTPAPTNTTSRIDNKPKKVAKTDEELIKEAKDLETQNIISNEIRSFEEEFGVDLIGSDYKDYFKVMNVDKTNVTVQCAGTMIHVMPYSDFIDSMEYHFDIKGNLVLYVIEQSGLGNKFKYFLDGDRIIKEEFVLQDEEYYSGDNSGEIMSFQTTKDINLAEVKEIANKLYDKYVLIKD